MGGIETDRTVTVSKGLFAVGECSLFPACVARTASVSSFRTGGTGGVWSSGWRTKAMERAATAGAANNAALDARGCRYWFQRHEKSGEPGKATKLVEDPR